MCSSRSRNCRGIELSSRDLKTVAISVTRAKPKNCRAYRETVEVSNYQAGTRYARYARYAQQFLIAICGEESDHIRY